MDRAEKIQEIINNGGKAPAPKKKAAAAGGGGDGDEKEKGSSEMDGIMQSNFGDGPKWSVRRNSLIPQTLTSWNHPQS